MIILVSKDVNISPNSWKANYLLTIISSVVLILYSSNKDSTQVLEISFVSLVILLLIRLTRICLDSTLIFDLSINLDIYSGLMSFTSMFYVDIFNNSSVMIASSLYESAFSIIQSKLSNVRWIAMIASLIIPASSLVSWHLWLRKSVPPSTNLAMKLCIMIPKPS